MAVPDLWWLADQVSARMVDAQERYPEYLGGIKTAQELSKVTHKISRQLSLVYEEIDGAGYFVGKVYDSEKEKRVKPLLLRLEFLLAEIEAFSEQGEEHPTRIHNLFIQFTSEEATLILDNLPEFSKYFNDFVTMESAFMRYDNEMTQLIELLSDSQSPRVIPILGKHGSGKSVLARRVCQDTRVMECFDSSHWVSLSNPNPTTLQSLMRAVAKSIFGEFNPNSFSNDFEHYLTYRKSLFVFDNLSNVEILKSLLSGNEKDAAYCTFLGATIKGSKILVTSSLDPLDVGVFAGVCLPGTSISEPDSWSLFRNTAPLYQTGMPLDLSPTKSQICQKYDNIPDIITIVSSFFSSGFTPEWKHFLDVVLPSVPDSNHSITAISYVLDLVSDRIQKERRHFFSWCSLLPIDHEFTKVDIFHLLRAQPFYKQNIVSEEDFDRYFSEFVTNGHFLQGEDSGTSVLSYKVSSLGHELMKQVAGDEFFFTDKPTAAPDYRLVRHASFIVEPSWQPPSWLSKAKSLRSLLLWPRKKGDVISLPKINLRLMRELHTLHFEAVHCESFPPFLATFQKLEYIKLGVVYSICLPEDNFILEKQLYCNPRQSSLIDGSHFGAQAGFSPLIKFSGTKKLTVQYEKCNGLDSLEEMQHILESLNVQPMISSYFDGDDGKIESLNPHQTLDSLDIRCWKGDTLPDWAMDELSNFFHNLVSIQLVNCSGCRYVPSFSMLPHLHTLQLRGMYSLAVIEIRSEKNDASYTKTFYPSLKFLVLCDLPELIGWSTKEGEPQQYCFPLLAQIRIQGCQKLTSMPSVQTLVSLEAINMDGKVVKDLMRSQEALSPGQDSQELTETSNQHLSLLRKLEIDGCKNFGWRDNLNFAEKGVWRGFKYLHSLKLSNIAELVSLPMDLEYITTLQQLSLRWLANLKFLPEWIGQLTQLRQLTIHYCPKLIMLPKAVSSFSALEQLDIRYCPRLNQFPESLPSLTTLRVQEFTELEQILRASQNLEELEINSCEELEWDTDYSRGECENSSVQVWGGLQRIRNVKLSNITELEPLSKGLEWLSTVNRLSLSRLHNLIIIPDWIENFNELQQLSIQFCPKLTTLDESISNLDNLSKLQIQYCPKLTTLPTSFRLWNLKQLHIQHCPKLTALPESICSLTALQQLLIQNCPELRQLPRSIERLTSLKQLEIMESPQLEKRCQYQVGEDWRLIEDIPNVFCSGVGQQGDSTYISFP